MRENCRVILITYDGAELLDLAGPSAVFSAANRVARRTLYDIVVASPLGGNVRHSCGVEMTTLPLQQIEFGEGDTVLIMGADSRPLAGAMADAHLKLALRSAARSASRYGSVCTGVFVLAAAGVLQGKTVATHWSAATRLSSLFPDIECNADALYIVQGRLWTSAGVTTGIDMALALLEHDHGAPLKASVARQLVVNSHRPGHQSQFSELLAAQAKADKRFAGLVDWLSASTASHIPVERMAEHVGMSPRNFHRLFVDQFGEPPAKFFETLRLNAARGLLESGQPVAHVTAQAGYRSESAFRTAFKKRFGVTPQLYRENWLSA